MNPREQEVKEAIDRGNIEELLRLAEGYPCACMGAKFDEPQCYCDMNSLQVRHAVSYAALKRGRLVYVKQEA